MNFPHLSTTGTSGLGPKVVLLPSLDQQGRELIPFPIPIVVVDEVQRLEEVTTVTKTYERKRVNYEKDIRDVSFFESSYTHIQKYTYELCHKVRVCVYVCVHLCIHIQL